MAWLNIHDATTHLLKLLGRMPLRTSLVTATTKRRLAGLRPLNIEVPAPTRRLGFMANVIAAPDDFDAMGAIEIVSMFDAPTDIHS